MEREDGSSESEKTDGWSLYVVQSFTGYCLLLAAVLLHCMYVVCDAFYILPGRPPLQVDMVRPVQQVNHH